MLPAYIQSHAFPLRSVTDCSDFSDLQPLKTILRNVRIVGLGESTHGTREFFQLKHRLTRFLVEEMGFSVFSLEAGRLPCMNIHEFSFMGKGERAPALESQGYWTWDTEEVSDLIDWIREHNLHCERGEECHFAGYDIKPIREAVSAVLRITAKGCPDLSAKAESLLADVTSAPFPASEIGAVSADGILWLWGALASREVDIAQRCGRPAFELAMTSCRMIWQYVDGMLNCSNYSGRDHHMAENIFRLIDSLPSDAKIVVWAHNYHISRNPALPTMGELLHRRYGSLYFPFALTFTRGTFQSRLMPPDGDENKPFGDLQEFDAGEPRRGFWERDLMEHPGDYFFDLRDARNHDGDSLAWAAQRKQLFGAGGGYIPIPEDLPDDQQVFESYELGRAFDGVFHIEKTTRARPTPTGMRKAGQPAR